MTEKHMAPRLQFLDLEAAREALQFRTHHIAKLSRLLEDEPTRFAQSRYSSLASDNETVAYYTYALGFPLVEVKDSLRLAAKACLEVFRRRGDEPAFQAYAMRYDPRLPPTDPQSTGGLHRVEEEDYSLTNSEKGYRSVLLALCASEYDIATELASLIWDPSDASYIGPRSFCTPNDQRLAYAIRGLFAEDHEAVEQELAALANPPVHLSCLSQMIRAASEGDPRLFNEGLLCLLEWHREESQKGDNVYLPRFYMCASGLGMSAAAVARGVCSLDGLPKGDVYLPVDLLLV